MRTDRDAMISLFEALPAALLYIENGRVAVMNRAAAAIFPGAAGRQTERLFEGADIAGLSEHSDGVCSASVSGAHFTVHTGRYGAGYVVLLCHKEDTLKIVPRGTSVAAAIRDALSGILAPLELLRPIAGAGESFGMIRKNVCLLLRLVTEMELLSPGAVFAPEPGDLAACVGDALSCARPYAGAVGMELCSRIPAKRVQAVFDRPLLESTVYRLISGAALRPEISELTFTLSTTSTGAVLSVSDNDRTTAGRQDGSLTVACIRKAAELHGGTVFIESLPGRSTTVTLSFDSHPAEACPGTDDLTCGFDSALVEFSVFLPAGFYQ